MSLSANDIISSETIQSSFVQEAAPQSLRITCYGSSSSKTPEKYLKEARNLGYILARRGHVCVNGAGSFGCMAAMNDGAVAGNGHIVGVIHRMWLVDQGDWNSSSTNGKSLRDGGAHAVFGNEKVTSNGPIREMLVADGPDLQERKRLLVDQADALVVLPGGPGTWDELWEMACARKLGLEHSLPICVINCDQFYQPFMEMMERAYQDRLLEQNPDEIIHFVDTAEEAVRWVERIQNSDVVGAKLKERKTPLPSATSRSNADFWNATLLFAAGVSVGILVNSLAHKR